MSGLNVQSLKLWSMSMVYLAKERNELNNASGFESQSTSNPVNLPKRTQLGFSVSLDCLMKSIFSQRHKIVWIPSVFVIVYKSFFEMGNMKHRVNQCACQASHKILFMSGVRSYFLFCLLFWQRFRTTERT